MLGMAHYDGAPLPLEPPSEDDAEPDPEDLFDQDLDPAAAPLDEPPRGRPATPCAHPQPIDPWVDVAGRQVCNVCHPDPNPARPS